MPETTIDKIKAKKLKGKKKKGKAKARFSGASQIDPSRLSFECKIDKKDFKPCDSPEKFKKLKAKKHKLQVRAIDVPTGSVDATPAQRQVQDQAEAQAPPPLSTRAGRA